MRANTPDGRLILLLGLAALVTAVIVSVLPGHTPNSGHLASKGHQSSKPLVELVADDANVTLASGSYDMTYDDTTTAPTNCPQEISGDGQSVGGSGTPGPACSGYSFSDISGHGTVDTIPYAMVTVGQVGPLGTITLYDNGTNVWEIGGGDYGLAGPGQAGPGAPLSGYASSVEGTLGQQAGALDMQGLASGTGYLDLEAQEIQGATPAGTGTVDGVAVTIYKLSESGLQDPDLTGLTANRSPPSGPPTPSLNRVASPGRRPGSPSTPTATSARSAPPTRSPMDRASPRTRYSRTSVAPAPCSCPTRRVRRLLRPDASAPTRPGTS